VSEYLVDTDWLILALKGDERNNITLEALAPSGLAVSVVTYGELYHGAYFARDRIRALELLGDILDGKEILPVTVAIMERFAIARAGLTHPTRRHIGDMDLIIAATALHHDLTLLTRNLRHFRRVAGLKLFGQRSPTSAWIATLPVRSRSLRLPTEGVETPAGAAFAMQRAHGPLRKAADLPVR
jgi:predicted nucleic acid-binding protein